MLIIFKRNFNILIIFIVLLIFGLNTVSANSGDTLENNQTILELKENIQILESKKVINFSIFEKFKLENGELKNYFYSNLTSQDLLEIEKSITFYNNKFLEINPNSEDYVERNIEIKKELYDSFGKYIDDSKKDLFNLFIEKEFSTIINEKKIKKDLEDNKEILDNKVSMIKEKIKENYEKEQEKLDILLEEKIKNRIINFKNSPKILLLSEKKQKYLFENVLKKIKNKRKERLNKTKKEEKNFDIIEKVLEEIIKEL